MHFFAERHRLTDENYCEVRFDDLVRDPLGQLRRVYQRLRLPTFDYVEPAVQEYIHSIKGYARNSFEPMTDPIRERVTLRMVSIF